MLTVYFAKCKTGTRQCSTNNTRQRRLCRQLFCRAKPLLNAIWVVAFGIRQSRWIYFSMTILLMADTKLSYNKIAFYNKNLGFVIDKLQPSTSMKKSGIVTKTVIEEHRFSSQIAHATHLWWSALELWRIGLWSFLGPTSQPSYPEHSSTHSHFHSSFDFYRTLSI